WPTHPIPMSCDTPFACPGSPHCQPDLSARPKKGHLTCAFMVSWAACAFRRSARRVHRRGHLNAGGPERGTFPDLPRDEPLRRRLVDAGCAIQRIGDYGEWLQRFETTLRALPERQRNSSLLPLLHKYQKPEKPINGSMAPTDRFPAAVRDAKVGPDKGIPHITPQIIAKYGSDLRLLGLLGGSHHDGEDRQ
ncbi:MAG: fatty acid CoA ligase FadD9, partial [Mycobacterium sp.]|nr:fatty acid CoA ligase FadD9 [Mycobacterium sp.]